MSIVTHLYGKKMCLSDGSTAIGVLELLAGDGTAVVTIDCGTGGNCNFSTDLAGVSTRAFAANVYKRVVVGVDTINDIIRCWISGNDSEYDPQFRVGVDKTYSGKAVTACRFRTTSGTTSATRTIADPGGKWLFEFDLRYTGSGIVYIGYPVVHVPVRAEFGDSIRAGKKWWDPHPQSVWRISSTVDETACPAYQLSLLYGSDAYVAGRGFGGATTAQLAAYVQSNIVDQWFDSIDISIGTNDLISAIPLVDMQANMDFLFSTLISGGIVGGGIHVGQTPPSQNFNAVAASKRWAFNASLFYKAEALGLVYVRNGDAVADPSNRDQLLPAYDEGDHYHYAKAANPVDALAFYDAVTARDSIATYTGVNILRPLDERLYPQGYFWKGGYSALHRLQRMRRAA